MRSKLSVIAVLLLLWNPVTLSILFQSMVWGVLISVAVLLLGLLISKNTSLRLKVWAFNIAALLSIAYHAELLFQQFAGIKDIPNLYTLHNKFYFNKPFLDRLFNDDEYESLYRTNCQGYRIDELTNADDSIKKCDWLFIGDSFTQGAQVNFGQMFTSLIYQDFPDKVIVNAGISGAGLYEELNYYRSMGRQLHPKRVYLQIGVFNDFKDVVEHKSTFRDYLSEKSSLYRYLSYQIENVNSSELPLGRWMEPFFVNHQDNVDYNILYKPSSKKKELDRQRFEKCIAEFKRCVEKDGGELVLILLPTKEQVSSEMLKATLKACNLDEKDIDLMAANRLCQEVADKEELILIDLYDDFCSEEFPFFEMDEHLNILGHELIAKKILAEFSEESSRYDYFSLANKNERYPSLLSDSISVLYQSQSRGEYLICAKQIIGNTTSVLWSSSKELIHPSMSPTMGELIFTTGYQDKQETEVILYNFEKDKQTTLNEVGTSASIPMFNNSGTQIVFPQWGFEENTIYIVVYDIAAKEIILKFADGEECWRPIFSKDDQIIYYICRETEKSNFIIKAFSIADKKIKTILRTDYNIWDIAISPSGKYLAYAGDKEGNWDLFLLNLEKGQTQQLTYTLGNEWDPSFGSSDYDLWFAGEFGFNNGIYHITINQ